MGSYFETEPRYWRKHAMYNFALWTSMTHRPTMIVSLSFSTTFDIVFHYLRKRITNSSTSPWWPLPDVLHRCYQALFQALSCLSVTTLPLHDRHHQQKMAYKSSTGNTDNSGHQSCREASGRSVYSLEHSSLPTPFSLNSFKGTLLP